MFHRAKAGVVPAPEAVAIDARRELGRLARPLGAFDPSRYFSADELVKFHNVPSAVVRGLARTIDQVYGQAWGIDGALAFAEALMPSAYLDEKGLGIELVARHRRQFDRSHLKVWKRWLSDGLASNWATTDTICGYLIGPLLVSTPALAPKVAAWANDATLWVRRASAVALIPLVRKGEQLDLAYRVAESLHDDSRDLIHKAVGWLLREAGKSDAGRLERYLRAHGPDIPRTTLRYAIERFPEKKRASLLRDTRD